MKLFVVSSWDGAFLHHGWWQDGPGYPFVYEPVEHEDAEARRLAAFGNTLTQTGKATVPQLLTLTREQLTHFVCEALATSNQSMWSN